MGPTISKAIDKAVGIALTTAIAVSLSHQTLLPQTKQTAQAHQVEIVEDIGATLHIEPNDTPRAGENVLAWFALTRRGGQTIPLSDCDCQLAVYTQPQGNTATLTPALEPVDAEGYQDIPGAQLIFPAVGTYTLVISGSPKQAADFTPFELDFDVTVAAGEAIASSPEESADTRSALLEEAPVSETAENRFPNRFPIGVLLGVGGIALLCGAIVLIRGQQKS